MVVQLLEVGALQRVKPGASSTERRRAIFSVTNGPSIELAWSGRRVNAAGKAILPTFGLRTKAQKTRTKFTVNGALARTHRETSGMPSSRTTWNPIRRV